MKNIQNFFNKPKKSPGGSTIVRHPLPENNPTIGFSEVPPEWQTLRENHYKKWLGDSKDIMVWHEIVPIIPHIDIHVFPPSKDMERNFYTLITSGMSDEKITLPKGTDSRFARTELVFYIADAKTQANEIERPWYINAINFFAHFPFNYKTWISIAHTIPNGNPPAPIMEGSQLTTAIFLPPIFERKEFVDDFKLGDEKVSFLWLAFLTDKETEYKLKFGIEKLVEKFNTRTFPQVFNPARPSII
jgi:hypothetical protein